MKEFFIKNKIVIGIVTLSIVIGLALGFTLALTYNNKAKNNIVQIPESEILPVDNEDETEEEPEIEPEVELEPEPLEEVFLLTCKMKQLIL